MAFHREDLITWNEFAPSFQASLRTLQTEISLREHRMFAKRISERLLHINALLKRHIKSDHPHPGSLNCLLRQPNTHYKSGDIVFDMELPPGCYLECLTEGITGNASEFAISEGFLTDQAYDYYSIPAHINEEIQEIYNFLQKHINIADIHPKALNFLIRQSNHYYDLGDVIFDPDAPPYCYLECIKSGITASIPEPTYDTAPVSETLQEVDEELKSILQELESHISNPIPHEKYKFLTRNPTYQYKIGDTVLYDARYQLECTVGGTTTTDVSDAVEQFLNTVKITMIDVRWGEAILVQTPEQNILFDTGIANTPTNADYLAAVENGRTEEVYYIQRKLLIDALEKRNVKTIHKLILTHPHGDHIQNAWILIGPTSNAKKSYPWLKSLTVQAVYDTGVKYTTTAYKNYLQKTLDKGIPYHALQSGETLDFGGGVSFDVLWPTIEFRNAVNNELENYITHKTPQTIKMNDTSLVGILRYKDFSMMFTGDAEKKAENNILTMYNNTSVNLHCDILKLGHHGNNTSSTAAFLRAISPSVAIISNGTLLKEDRYRKLSAGNKAVVTRCLDNNIPETNILSTRFNGDITISVDWNGRYSVSPSNVENWLYTPANTEEEEANIETDEQLDDHDEARDIPIDQTEASQSYFDSNLTITVVDVRFGDAIIIQTPTQTIVMDTGLKEQGTSPSLQRKLFMAALDKLHVTTIDKLIITHPHGDHIQNAWALIKPNAKLKAAYPVLKNIKVNAIYDNSVENVTESYKLYKDYALEKGIKRKSLYAGNLLDFGGGVIFEVLWPTPEYATRVNGYVNEYKNKTRSKLIGINNSSIAGILHYNGFSMFLTGDIKFDAERQILNRYTGRNLSCNILKLANHGYNSSTGHEFLEAVSPAAVIASRGPNSEDKYERYDNDSVLYNSLPVFNRCKEVGVLPDNMLYTRFNGNITVSVGSTGEYYITSEIKEDWYDQVRHYNTYINELDTGEDDDGGDENDQAHDDIGDD